MEEEEFLPCLETADQVPSKDFFGWVFHCPDSPFKNICQTICEGFAQLWMKLKV
jgi:hypothetical protein